MQLDPIFAAPERFLKGNIHTHSTLSDGKRAPEDVVETYHRGGYDFMALTDHFMARFGNPYLYRFQNLVERFLNKLKHFRAIATRYEKHDANYLALVKLAAARIWMQFMSW